MPNSVIFTASSPKKVPSDLKVIDFICCELDCGRFESQCQQSVGEDTPWTGHLSTTGQVSVKNDSKKLTTLEAKSTKTPGKYPVFKHVFTLNLVEKSLYCPIKHPMNYFISNYSRVVRLLPRY